MKEERRKPLTTAELFGKSTNTNFNLQNKKNNNFNSKQMCNNKNYQKQSKPKLNKNKQNTKKVQSTKQNSKWLKEDEIYKENEAVPTSGIIQVAVVKFTSDSKDYNFLISNKISLDTLKEMLTKQDLVAVNVWSNSNKKKPSTKQVAFVKEIISLDLDKLSDEEKPHAWLYRICKNQKNKQIKTNKEMIDYYRQRREKRKLYKQAQNQNLNQN